MRWLVVLALTLVIYVTADSSPHVVSTQSAYEEDGLTKLPLNEDASLEMLNKWVNQAVSGLMAAVVNQKLHHLDDDEKDDLHQCSQDAKSVPEHARCVVKVLDATKERKVIVAEKDTPISQLKRKQIKKQRVIGQDDEEETLDDLEWTGGFGRARARRQVGYKVVHRDSYSLKSEHDDTAIVRVAKQMTKTVRRLKKKKTPESWSSVIQRVKKLGDEAKKEKIEKEAMKKRLKMMIQATPTDFIDPRKPLAMKEIELEEEKHRKELKLKKEKADEVRVPMKVMRESLKMILEASGQNVTDFDKKTLKLVSPRMLSIVPEQEDDSLFNILSPSLFSLHSEGSKQERMFSLPSLLKGLNNNDQEAWMDFIIEASGVTDVVKDTEEKFKKRKEQTMLGPDGKPLYLTKSNVTEKFPSVETHKISVFEKLDKLYTKQQRDQMDSMGYAVLSSEQLKLVYGKDSPYAHKGSLKKFLKMRLKDDASQHIETDIRAIAEAEKFKVRAKDVTLSPLVLADLFMASEALSAPVTLSPLVLSPIVLSPAVLGPITLSPWVFIPLILSPRVLSPLILSPMIFSPIILSPLVLHPLILSPGVFNPLILSPLVLSPFILSPEVFTPLILSPMVLNPLILSPFVGSPLILSPFVLSPIICSPQTLTAIVLSPYALSPLIKSKLTAAELVLSPSWLS